MCYTQRKIEGGVGALRKSDDTNFLKPNGQSKTLPHVWIIATSYFDDYSNLVEKSVDFFRSAKVNDPRQSNQVVDTNWHR